MHVIVTNGDPAREARLKFDFLPDSLGTARLWLIKLPALKNPDAFARQLGSHSWELRLESVADTQPLEIMSYTPESAAQWLRDVFDDPHPAPAELLVLAHHNQFTITLHQSL
jgi:hypothetical protein